MRRQKLHLLLPCLAASLMLTGCATAVVSGIAAGGIVYAAFKPGSQEVASAQGAPEAPGAPLLLAPVEPVQIQAIE